MHKGCCKHSRPTYEYLPSVLKGEELICGQFCILYFLILMSTESGKFNAFMLNLYNHKLRGEKLMYLPGFQSECTHLVFTF